MLPEFNLSGHNSKKAVKLLYNQSVFFVFFSLKKGLFCQILLFVRDSTVHIIYSTLPIKLSSI